MRQLVLIISLSLFLAGSGFAAAEQDHSGHNHAVGSSTLTAIVTSGTANGKSTEGDKATLRISQNGQLIETINAVIDKDGKAIFNNVPFGPQLLSQVTVMHDEMSFNSRVVELKPEPSVHFAQVEVYDVSDDNSVLYVGTHHMIVKIMQNGIGVTEYIQLINPTDTAVFSKRLDSKGKQIIVEMGLPKGYKNLAFFDYLESSVITQTESGFYDTMAVPPGKHDCVFSYELDIDSEAMDIAKEITLGTSNITVFAQTGDTQITGLGQASGEVFMEDGLPANYYDLKDMKQGERIAFKITGLTPPKSEKDLWIMMSVIFGVVGVIAAKRLLTGNNENKAQEIESE